MHRSQRTGAVTWETRVLMNSPTGPRPGTVAVGQQCAEVRSRRPGDAANSSSAGTAGAIACAPATFRG